MTADTPEACAEDLRGVLSTDLTLVTLLDHEALDCVLMCFDQSDCDQFEHGPDPCHHHCGFGL
jgi:hypothetical protein